MCCAALRNSMPIEKLNLIDEGRPYKFGCLSTSSAYTSIVHVYMYVYICTQLVKIIAVSKFLCLEIYMKEISANNDPKYHFIM